jgi:hypothetical protein
MDEVKAFLGAWAPYLSIALTLFALLYQRRGLNQKDKSDYFAQMTEIIKQKDNRIKEVEEEADREIRERQRWQGLYLDFMEGRVAICLGRTMPPSNKR